MPVHYIPDGYHTVTPYLVLQGADRMIEFVKQAFDAVTVDRMDMPDGKVAHATVKIGESMIMLGEAGGEWKALQVMLHLYVPDADAVYAKALAAGATVVREIRDEPYGDRSGGVRDFAGNQWWIATHKEDLTQEEIEKRMAPYMQEKK